MIQKVNEPIDVLVMSKSKKGLVTPMRFRWKSHTYDVQELGLLHPVREGRNLYHIFTCTDGATTFRISCDTENLQFTLEQISDGLPD